MKYANRLLAISAIICLIIAASCKEKNPDPQPDPSEEAPGAALVGTWVVANAEDVTYDGANADIVSQYTDFEITIDTTAAGVVYTTQGSDNSTVFPPSGSFNGITEDTNFDNGATVTRGPDNVSTEMTLSNNGGTLTLEFNIAETTNARVYNSAKVNSVSGNYTFTLTKQ